MRLKPHLPQILHPHITKYRRGYGWLPGLSLIRVLYRLRDRKVVDIRERKECLVMCKGLGREWRLWIVWTEVEKRLPRKLSLS